MCLCTTPGTAHQYPVPTHARETNNLVPADGANSNLICGFKGLKLVFGEIFVELICCPLHYIQIDHTSYSYTVKDII